MFLERLSKNGIETSPYYIRGGVFNNYSSINQLPNCTAYCMLRTYEATNATKPYPVAQDNLGFPNAKDWFKKTPLAKGYELKLGAICVFDGNSGHVAYVERVIDNTHALISQSQYDDNKSLRNYKYFETREVELIVGQSTLKGIGNLIGYIYTPIKDIRVNRNYNKEQICINENMVNVRDDNFNIFRQGCYAPKGIYNVLDTKLVDDYIWYKIDENNWVREGDWITYYPASQIEELNIRVSKLESEVKELWKKLL